MYCTHYTQVKVLSFGTDSCEAAFGSFFPRICKLVQAKHNWCREQLLLNLAIRKVREGLREEPLLIGQM